MVLKRKTVILFFFGLFFSLPVFVGAQTPGTEVVFNIEPSYDFAGRQTVTAFLQQIGQNAYSYIEKDYYNKLSSLEKTELAGSINKLSYEFDNAIYPRLTDFYGQEAKPGIDGDNKITVLFFNIKQDAAGYFNSADQYPKAQVPSSNQREMVYLNVNKATSSLVKGYLAHEFAHLITFNQKDKMNNVAEETWLNEMRAEYAPTYLGYSNTYDGSILQQRVKDFLENPSDSLTAWQNRKTDYGIASLFGHYLADHYGSNILADSLKNSLIGIPSINLALKQNGFQDDFALIFTRWTIAIVANDCSLGVRYCYLSSNLKNLRISPHVNFLPLSGESSLSVLNATYNWSGNWFKIVGGGKGTFTLEFDGDDTVSFKIPYIICDKFEKCQIQTLALDEQQKGKIVLGDFSSKYAYLTIIPSIQSKISGFDGFESTFLFSWKASVSTGAQKENNAKGAEIAALLAQIEQLKKQIANLQAQIAFLVAGDSTACQKFDKDLYFGMENSQDIRCLQQFLKKQGSAIYPEGLITGNFFSLTQAAVKRYQAAKGIMQTGYFGPLTRAEANK